MRSVRPEISAKKKNFFFVYTTWRAQIWSNEEESNSKDQKKTEELERMCRDYGAFILGITYG